MRLSDRNLTLVLTLATAVTLAGCNPAMFGPAGDDSDSADPKPGGQLKVRVTDAPFPIEFVDEAWVTITRIDVLRCPDNADDDPHEPGDPNDPNDGDGGDDDGDGDRPWITVFDDPNGLPFNLMTLRNGRLADLVDAELPAGSYKQIRVYVDGGRVVLTDGRWFPLRVPSGDRSGIKLRLKFEIVEGEDTEVLLDFDLVRTFKPIPGGAFQHAGEIRGFMFRPSLGLRAADLGESGSLGGEAADDQGDPESGVEVVAYRGKKLVATTYTEADGSYTFVGLSPGNYRLEFQGDDDFEPRELRTRVQRGKHTNNANSRSGKRMSGD